jgi:pimeloyl-ACP methyl ester carboxylesterase
MRAELITLETTDGLTHYGALYGAARGRRRDLAVVLVHGMTGSFIGEVESALPPILARSGYTCLVANNRGHGSSARPPSASLESYRMPAPPWIRGGCG